MGLWVNTQKVFEILFGLLSVSCILPDEIKNDIKSSIKPNFRITIFLRSDIYSFVKKIAREKDKLEVGRIEWNDKEVLGRVLDERIMMNMDNKLPEQIWSEFFESNVDSKSPRQFILSMTRPRPQDSIFFLKAAISKAISRGHGKVTVEDMFSASEEYSRWAYDSLIDEDYPEKRHMENLLYEFINDKYIYEETELDEILLQIIGNIEDAEEYKTLLLDSQFLGIEFKDNDYKIVDDHNDRKLVLVAARKRAERANKSIKFRVDRPFWSILQIEG